MVSKNLSVCLWSKNHLKKVCRFGGQSCFVCAFLLWKQVIYDKIPNLPKFWTKNCPVSHHKQGVWNLPHKFHLYLIIMLCPNCKLRLILLFLSFLKPTKVIVTGATVVNSGNKKKVKSWSKKTKLKVDQKKNKLISTFLTLRQKCFFFQENNLTGPNGIFSETLSN